MPEELNPTPTPAPDAPAIAPVPAAAPDKAPAPRLLDDANLTDAPADDGAGAADDWRAAYGEDKEVQKLLARLASPAEVAKKLLNQEKTLRSRSALPTLPEGATEQEIAAHRKALGIPEKPEGYGLSFPEEWKPTDADKAGLSAFQEYAHDKGLTPAATKAAFEFYAQHMASGQAARAEAASEATLENLGELRAAFPGREFKRNMTIAEDFLAKHFEGSEQALDMVLGATLPNGVKVKSFAPFVKGLVQMARSYADEEVLISGDGGGGGRSLEDEKDALLDKSAAGRLTKAEDARLTQIYEAITAKEARAGRGSARP